MIEIKCPECNYTRSIPLEKIPDRARWVKCPKCGNRFKYLRGGREDVKSKGRHAIPWENRLQLGLWSSIKRTIKSVLFSPKRLFSDMKISGGWKEPLAFGLLIGSIGSMFTFFWEFIIATSGFFETIWGILPSHNPSPMIFIFLIFLSPLFVTIDLFISSLIIHLLFLIVGVGKGRFETTFRVIAYSQATKVWSFIPFLGSPIGWAWKCIVQVIGLKEAHDITYTKIIFAFSIPLVLLLLFAFGLLYFIIYFLGF
jgi:predicted Zn finger-like uncharacterized protein